MANTVGIVKDILGSVTVKKSQGIEKILSIGDEIELDDILIFDSIDSNAIITINNEEITITGFDKFVINQDFIDSNSTSNLLSDNTDLNELQKAILDGQGLDALEETAAGGETGALGLEGASLGNGGFIRSGSISNVNINYGSLENYENTARALFTETGESSTADNTIVATSTIDTATDNSNTIDSGAIPPLDNSTIIIPPAVYLLEFMTEVQYQNGIMGGVGNLFDGDAVKDNQPTIKGGSNGASSITLTITNSLGEVIDSTEVTPKSNGDFIYTLNTPLPTDGKYTVSVVAKNSAGDISPEARGNITIDNTAPDKPTIVFDADANKDGIINIDEFVLSKASNQKTTATIKLPDNAKVGDKLTFTIKDYAGTTTDTVDITDDHLKDGYKTQEFLIGDTRKPEITAFITDKLGNVGTSAIAMIDTDRDAPIIHSVAIKRDVDSTKSTVVFQINDSEINGSIKVEGPNGEIPSSIIYNKASKSWVAEFDNHVFNRGDKINIEATDKAGNKGTNTTVVQTNMAPKIEFIEDKKHDGQLTRIENKDDTKETTTVKVTLPEDVELGDRLQLRKFAIDEIHITSADIAKGSVSIIVNTPYQESVNVVSSIIGKAGMTNNSKYTHKTGYTEVEIPLKDGLQEGDILKITKQTIEVIGLTSDQIADKEILRDVVVDNGDSYSASAQILGKYGDKSEISRDAIDVNLTPNLSIEVNSVITKVSYESEISNTSNHTDNGVTGLNGKYWLHNISDNGFDDLITYARNGIKNQMDWQTNDTLQDAINILDAKRGGDRNLNVDATFKASAISFGDQDTSKKSTNISLETNSTASDGNLVKFLRQDGGSVEYTAEGRFGDNGSSYAAGAFGLIELSGYVYLEKGKSYDFKFVSDDGVRLVIDGNKIEVDEVRNATTGNKVSNQSQLLSHGLEETITNIYAYYGSTIYNGETGLVPITVTYYDIVGRSDLQIFVKDSDESEDKFAILGTKDSGVYLYSSKDIDINNDGSVNLKTISNISGNADNIADGEDVEIYINNEVTPIKVAVKDGKYEFDFEGKVDSAVVKFENATASASSGDIVVTEQNYTPEPQANITINSIEIDGSEKDDIGYTLAELVSISNNKSTDANTLFTPSQNAPVVGLNGKYYITAEEYFAISQAKEYLAENADNYNASFDAYKLSNSTRASETNNKSIASESAFYDGIGKQGTFLFPWAQGGKSMPSGNVKFADGNNIDSGKTAIVTYDGYIYLEGGKKYTFYAHSIGAFEVKIDGQNVFKDTSFATDRIIPESLDSNGDTQYTTGRHIISEFSVENSGFYKIDMTYLNLSNPDDSTATNSSGFTLHTKNESGVNIVVGDTANGGLTIVKDYYELGSDGKYHAVKDGYDTTISGEAQNVADGNQLDIYHNGDYIGSTSVINGQYSFEYNFNDNKNLNSDNFDIRVNKNVSILELNGNSIETAVNLHGNSSIDTLVIKNSSNESIDFSAINQDQFDSKVSDFEKIQLGGYKNNDNEAIEVINLSAQDVLDITDNKDVILKIDGDSNDKIDLKNFTVSSNQNDVDSGYTRYESQTLDKTIQIDVDNDISKYHP